jgi:hypothetical protein
VAASPSAADAADAAACTAAEDISVYHIRLAFFAARAAGAFDAERDAQADLVRDIFGNPFRFPRFDPAWLTCNDACAVKLAKGIYEERAFDRLPILADALEDAGCTDPDFLGHCRSAGRHVRGCWVIDRLLDKQ